MSTTTTRNSLVKPGYADAADIGVINTNMDTIDASFALCNWAAAADPAVGDDSADGYSIGSIWFNTTGHKAFIAEDVTAGAAVWRKIYPGGSPVVSASNPTVNDDTGDGYEIGQIWFNTTNNRYFVAKSVTLGAAVWMLIGVGNNYGASAAPTASDDIADGYGIGSQWLDTTNNKLYTCKDHSAGAAVWKQVPMTDYAWDIGAVEIRALTFQSDEPTAAPFTVASTTKVTNLNADQLDGLHDTSFVKQTLADAKGDLIVASGADAWAREAVSATDGYCLVSDASATNGVSWQPMYSGAGVNMLLNGNMMVHQHGISQITSATSIVNNDDTYITDQWTLLSDGNDVMDVWPTAATGPVGKGGSILLQTETANKKAGIINFIEYKQCRAALGGTVSLRFSCYTNSSYPNANVMAGVLTWSGTADAVTSDVVSAWNAAGAAPTLATNWTFENTPAQLALVQDAWTEYKIENISIDTSNGTNLAVFIWLDDTDSAVDDRLYISSVQLNLGPTCLPWTPQEYTSQLLQCQRFFYTINAAAGAYPHLGSGNANTTSSVYIEYHHPSEWFGATATMSLIGSNWVIAGNAVTTYASEGDKKQITYRVTGTGTPFTQYYTYLVYANNETTARCYVYSRM